MNTEAFIHSFDPKRHLLGEKPKGIKYVWGSDKTAVPRDRPNRLLLPWCGGVTSDDRAEPVSERGDEAGAR
jgi:hypothetical protein